jgi:hypothetical protein
MVRLHVSHALQGMDWCGHPPWAMEMAREYFHDIANGEKDAHMLVEHVMTRYRRLEARLRELTQSGRPIRSIHEVIVREDQPDLL